MITQCNDCRLYRSEKEPTPCPNCHPVYVKRVMCGNDCDRPAVAVTEPVGYAFCSPCYAGFLLGQRYPNEGVKVSDEDDGRPRT